MTTEEIIEGNKLIAEFMGFQKCNCIRNENGRYYDYYLSDKFELIKEVKICIEGEHGFGLENQDLCFIEDLKFHSSWDWLIPVIDKIHSSNYYVDYYLSELGQFNNGVHINTKFIEVSFNVVVEYIKWYNVQNK